MNRVLDVIHMKMTVQIAVQRIREAIHTFQLKCCMSDIIAMTNDLADLTLNIRADADVKVIGENMGRHRPQALREAPDMDVMNAKHAVHLNNVVHHLFDVDIARRGFEQNIHCIAQDTPGIIKDEEADQAH